MNYFSRLHDAQQRWCLHGIEAILASHCRLIEIAGPTLTDEECAMLV